MVKIVKWLGSGKGSEARGRFVLNFESKGYSLIKCMIKKVVCYNTKSNVNCLWSYTQSTAILFFFFLKGILVISPYSLRGFLY